MFKLNAVFRIYAPFILTFVLTGIIQIYLIWINHGNYIFNGIDICTSLIYDCVAALILSAFLFPILVGISSIDKSISKIAGHFLFILLILIQIGLVQFYSYNLYPLDNVIFLYSLKEIKTIVLSSGGISITSVSIVCLSIVLYFVLYLFLRNSVRIKSIIFYCIIVFLISVCVIRSDFFMVSQGNGFFTNKSMLFYYSLVQSRQKNVIYDIKTNEEISKDLIHTTPTNVLYPLERKFDIDNVLAPFFKPTDEKPNVVILFVEGLSRTFSGENAKFGSYTPFLDSLATSSIYFSNFLSDCERTFGAIPNILGSLPPAVNGFMLANTHMPHHESILTVLKKNGYYSSFFFVGNADFDNMEYFFYKEGIDTIIDKDRYGSEYRPIGYFRYSDFDLFKKSFEIISKTPNPKLSIYLTMGIHEPFICTTGNLFDAFLQKNSNTMLSADLLKSVMESDFSISKFIREYKKRDDFKNTIFVITGDHSPSAINVENSLDNFRVPLIIYSPLLKKAANIKSVSSHIDVYPSLLSLLKNTYGIKCPDQCHFISYGLDTCRNFRNNHLIPLMTVNKTVSKIIWKNIYYDGRAVYSLDQQLNITRIDDEKTLAEVKKKLNDFNKLDYFVFQQNALCDQHKSIDFSSVQSNLQKVDLFNEPAFLDKVKCYKSTHVDSVLVDSIPEFINLLGYKVSDSDGFINISLNVESKRISKSGSPNIVIDVHKDSTLYYRSEPIIRERTARVWNKQKYVFSINKAKNKIQAGSDVKIYIWNPHKCVWKASSINLEMNQ